MPLVLDSVGKVSRKRSSLGCLQRVTRLRRLVTVEVDRAVFLGLCRS